MGTLLLLAVLLPATPEAAVEVVLKMVDGRELSAETLRLDEQGMLTAKIGTTTETVSLDSVLSAEIRGGASSSLAEGDVLVRLVDGSELTGHLQRGQEDLIVLETAALGPVRLPIDLVDAASLGPREVRVDPSSLSTQGDEDVVYRRGPVEGDVLTGTLVRVGSEGVEVDGDLGVILIELDQVLGVAVAYFSAINEEEDAAALKVELELAGGGLLVGVLRELTTRGIRVATRFDDDLLIRLDRLSRIRFSSDRFTYLSDLDPVRVEQIPYIGDSNEVLFPWRRDRTVTGRPILIGGRFFGKGIGCHSRARLTYELGARFDRLEATLGVSDEVLELGIRGSVIFRVQVDGERRYQSPIVRAGDGILEMPSVPLAGARELTIEVDFADHGDVGDRAVLGEAILIKNVE